MSPQRSISALIQSLHQNPFQVLELAREGKINLTVSEPILAEMPDVLRRKFGWPEERIAKGREWITDMAKIVTPAVQLQVVKEDPADDRILECAVTAGSDFIVSGDKDLLRLARYDSIRIVNAADFLGAFQSTSKAL